MIGAGLVRSNILHSPSSRSPLRSFKGFSLFPVKIPLITPVPYHIIDGYVIDKQLTVALLHLSGREYGRIELKRDFLTHWRELT